jgi:superfamily II DNA or RNA helicase
LLTKTGNGRDYTIWQTIQNTASAKLDHFYVIIDEAHQGMMQSNRDREQAATIMQRFIKGYSEVGLQPVKLTIGMSATPERFNRVIAGLDRTKREYTILPKDAKDAGLIKDKIILFHPKERQPAEWGMLEEATPKTFKIRTTPENIDDLFLQCGRRLGDEGLHMEYWKAQQDKENPFKVKLELFGILQNKAAWEKLEHVCEEKIQQFF